MPLPDTDDAGVFGGANLLDFGGQGPIDPTTDRGAAAVNPLVNDVACMTHTAIRAWVRFTPAGTGTPALVANDSLWAGSKDINNNPLNTAPVVARTGVGLYVVNQPATVYDEIQPSGSPGYIGPHTLNLRAGWLPPVVSGGVFYVPYISVITGGVVGISIYVGSTLTDPNGPSFDLFCI